MQNLGLCKCRIQLPVNDAMPLEGPRPGVMIGEGKPENQNHAIIFCFGECLQSIDMNQVRFSAHKQAHK